MFKFVSAFDKVAFAHCVCLFCVLLCSGKKKKHPSSLLLMTIKKSIYGNVSTSGRNGKGNNGQERNEASVQIEKMFCSKKAPEAQWRRLQSLSCTFCKLDYHSQKKNRENFVSFVCEASAPPQQQFNSRLCFSWSECLYITLLFFTTQTQTAENCISKEEHSDPECIFEARKM